MIKTRHLIGGEWLEPEGERIPDFNPSTGRQIGEIGIGTAKEVSRAVTAARDAFDTGWRDTPGSQRRSLIARLARLIQDNAMELAQISAEDMGMPVTFAMGEAYFAAEWLDYYAGWADKIEGAVIPVGAPGVFDYTLREPVGVVGAIVPWNAPVSLAAFKLGPALAAGNTVVIKPSEYAPNPIAKLAELALEAGFPPGVINVVTGDGTTGSALVEEADLISFTGGTKTGRAVAEACGRHLKKCALELGGKSANVVFADADLDAAASMAVPACFVNSGQQCIAGSRLLVEEEIHDDLVERVVNAMRAYKMGDASQPDVQLGPLISAAAQERVTKLIENATNVQRGGQHADGGYFVEPAVITGVANDMPLAKDEIFGPVLSVIRFKDEADAIRVANDTDYGLAGGVWTRDLSRAHRVAKAIKAGTVWVNAWLGLNPGAPFGGYKASGLGREGGREALAHYLQTKNVYVQT